MFQSRSQDFKSGEELVIIRSHGITDLSPKLIPVAVANFLVDLVNLLLYNITSTPRGSVAFKNSEQFPYGFYPMRPGVYSIYIVLNEAPPFEVALISRPPSVLPLPTWTCFRPFCLSLEAIKSSNSRRWRLERSSMRCLLLGRRIS